MTRTHIIRHKLMPPIRGPWPFMARGGDFSFPLHGQKDLPKAKQEATEDERGMLRNARSLCLSSTKNRLPCLSLGLYSLGLCMVLRHIQRLLTKSLTVLHTTCPAKPGAQRLWRVPAPGCAVLSRTSQFSGDAPRSHGLRALKVYKGWLM